jgi:hypothetical protein
VHAPPSSFNKGGKYCLMCATPHPKRQAVLGVLAADVAAHATFTRAVFDAPMAIAALPVVVAKEAGTVNGTPVLVANMSKVPVARKAKALK